MRLAQAHLLIGEGLRSDAEKSTVVSQRIMDLAVGNAPCHHNIGCRVCFREHILDLFAGLDVPIRHIVICHVLFPLFPVGALSLCNRPLSNCLHDLEGLCRLYAHRDQIEHNIVSGTDRGRNGRHPAHDQILGIAQPHVGSVGQTGNTNQIGESLRLCIDYHLHRKVCAELRNSQCSQPCSANLFRRDTKCFRILEQAHDIRSVQGNGQGISSRHILQHSDHGRIIVSQNIQLQKVMIDGVIVKVGGDGIRGHIVGGMLHRREGIDILSQGQHDDSSGMLTGSSSDTHTTCYDSIDLAGTLCLASLFKIFLDITEGCLICKGADGAGTEGLSCSEDHLCVFVRFGLILTGEIQVDIRLLVSLKA